LQQALESVNPKLLQESNGSKEKTFAELYHAYSPALYRAINKVLKNPSLSQDVLQNTFVKIWLHQASYDSCKSCPFTWMLNIACHEAIDTLRSKRHRQAIVTAPLDEAILDGSNPFLYLDYMDVHKQLFILKPRDRAILELCFFRGYTCQQTAELLSVPCGTVKTRMQHSYKVLRAALLEPAAAF
jgi:RNA polymerase sigma-70 factor (ECF subfamily)